jgi:hypothetical protein
MQVCGTEMLRNPRIMSFTRLFIMSVLVLVFFFGVFAELSIHLVCINNRGVLRAFLIFCLLCMQIVEEETAESITCLSGAK